MRIIKCLRNENSIIPIEVEVFHIKLTKMRRHTLEILDFLPVIEIIRTSSICQFIPSSPVRNLGLFGNHDKLKRSHDTEEKPSKIPRTTAS
jgi:hypothetical protein